MKVTIEIYPKEIKKLLELLDLIGKKPEYIYKGDSSKSQEPIPIDNREVKKSDEPFFRKISDMPYESVKYNKKAKDKDSSIIKSDIPFHDNASTSYDDSEQFKKDIEKLFNEVFGTDNTKD